jgi:hypothetical protein
VSWRARALTRLRAAPPSLLSPDVSYDDLLLSSRPFPQPVPLGVRAPQRNVCRVRVFVGGNNTCFLGLTRARAAGSQEVVDFLVECWDEDGLYA